MSDDTKPGWESLRDLALETIREELADLAAEVDREKLDEFVQRQVRLYAIEWHAAKTADTPEQQKEHLDNLKHLRAQVRGEIARLQLGMGAVLQGAVVRIVQALGGLILRLAQNRI